MLREFKEFALKGNLIDLAVGFILGTAFAALVNSFVKDIIMPPVGLIWGRDFTNLFALLKEGSPGGPYASLSAAQDAGAVTINYGAFINLLITFVIVALVLFFVVKAANQLKRTKEEAVTTKTCPFCLTKVPLGATRCPACTSELPRA